jgi:hypothetical protein
VAVVESITWRVTMNINDETGKGSYFGIEVKVLVCLNHCSPVRYQGRELIVDTADLIWSQPLGRAA